MSLARNFVLEMLFIRLRQSGVAACAICSFCRAANMSACSYQLLGSALSPSYSEVGAEQLGVNMLPVSALCELCTRALSCSFDC